MVGPVLLGFVGEGGGYGEWYEYVTEGAMITSMLKSYTMMDVGWVGFDSRCQSNLSTLICMNA